MSEFEKREVYVYVRMTRSEKAQVIERMNKLQIKNMAAYCRKMILNGYIVNLDVESIKEVISLLRYTSNNMNQYAKKANENGSIYRADIRELQKLLDEIWEKMKELIVIYSSI